MIRGFCCILTLLLIVIHLYASASMHVCACVCACVGEGGYANAQDRDVATDGVEPVTKMKRDRARGSDKYTPLHSEYTKDKPTT